MKKWTVESLSLAGVWVVLGLAVGFAIVAWDHLALSNNAGRFVGYGLFFLIVLMAAMSTFILLRIRSLTMSRKAAFGSLERGKRRYRTLVDTAHEGIWFIDMQARSTFANPSLAHMFGYSVEEMMGGPVHGYLAESARDALADILTSLGTEVHCTHDLCYLRK